MSTIEELQKLSEREDHVKFKKLLPMETPGQRGIIGYNPKKNKR